MAIYLDTNILMRWPGFAALDRVALSIVSDQLRLPIVGGAEATRWSPRSPARRANSRVRRRTPSSSCADPMKARLGLRHQRKAPAA